jgi:hypothetical protein
VPTLHRSRKRIETLKEISIEPEPLRVNDFPPALHLPRFILKNARGVFARELSPDLIPIIHADTEERVIAFRTRVQLAKDFRLFADDLVRLLRMLSDELDPGSPMADFP